jgi:hypothetical protein
LSGANALVSELSPTDIVLLVGGSGCTPGIASGLRQDARVLVGLVAALSPSGSCGSGRNAETLPTPVRSRLSFASASSSYAYPYGYASAWCWCSSEEATNVLVDAAELLVAVAAVLLL